jgi:hypothetical protein
MFLGSYHFDGEPDALIPLYERLVSSLPGDSIELHVCIRTDSGITVFDTCPSREVFDGFTTSTGFAEAVAAAGLPSPRIEPLGSVVQTLGKAFAS